MPCITPKQRPTITGLPRGIQIEVLVSLPFESTPLTQHLLQLGFSFPTIDIRSTGNSFFWAHLSTDAGSFPPIFSEGTPGYKSRRGQRHKAEHLEYFFRSLRLKLAGHHMHTRIAGWQQACLRNVSPAIPLAFRCSCASSRVKPTPERLSQPQGGPSVAIVSYKVIVIHVLSVLCEHLFVTERQKLVRSESCGQDRYWEMPCKRGRVQHCELSPFPVTVPIFPFS